MLMRDDDRRTAVVVALCIALAALLVLSLE